MPVDPSAHHPMGWTQQSAQAPEEYHRTDPSFSRPSSSHVPDRRNRLGPSGTDHSSPSTPAPPDSEKAAVLQRFACLSDAEGEQRLARLLLGSEMLKLSWSGRHCTRMYLFRLAGGGRKLEWHNLQTGAVKSVYLHEIVRLQLRSEEGQFSLELADYEIFLQALHAEDYWNWTLGLMYLLKLHASLPFEEFDRRRLERRARLHALDGDLTARVLGSLGKAAPQHQGPSVPAASSLHPSHPSTDPHHFGAHQHRPQPLMQQRRGDQFDPRRRPTDERDARVLPNPSLGSAVGGGQSSAASASASRPLSTSAGLRPPSSASHGR